MGDSEGFTTVSRDRRSRSTTCQSSPPNRQYSGNWQDGEIAFLKPHCQFNPAAYKDLIDSGYLHVKATGHPVIVLGHSEGSSHYVVTTISAYGSGPNNDYLPPWEQAYHRSKDRSAFRAFRGSVRPNPHRRFLELEGSESLPKPKTSWVYAKNAFVVPSSTLKKFDKVNGIPRLTQGSLEDLLRHFGESQDFRRRWTDPRVIKMLGLEPRTPSPPRDAKPEVPTAATRPGINTAPKSIPASEAPPKSTRETNLTVTPRITWSAVVKRPVPKPS
ncbi:hypothetical protein F4774DRAFT_408986 [Daldinia eschscholtzii]|nr:hypothetical protein F4774DRAFT_408986 [Daldinia eschscholtzii]